MRALEVSAVTGKACVFALGMPVKCRAVTNLLPYLNKFISHKKAELSLAKVDFLQESMAASGNTKLF